MGKLMGVSIDMKARLVSKTRKIKDHITGRKREKVYCFKHAVKAALKGDDIELEVDDFGGECDCRHTYCDVCK